MNNKNYLKKEEFNPDLKENNCECENINHHIKESNECEKNHKHENEEHGKCENEHEGCACETSLLENIDHTTKKNSKKPLYTLGIGVIIFIIGYSISILNFSIFEISTINLFGNIEPVSKIISLIIYLTVVIITGKNIIKKGINHFLKKEVKIEFLITIATIGAFLLGDGAEGASLMLLFFLAEYLESFSLDRSKKSLAKLVKLSPDVATVKKGSEEVKLKTSQIDIGDIVIVRPGDKIPVDGIIKHGETSINQSSITGESLAVNKKSGDEVYASTINEEGYIEIEVNKTSEDTIFSKIIELIKESEEKKAKIDVFIDKFAKYYTPTIVGIAILIAIIPYLFFGQSLNEWVYRSLVLLVISCPCALVISTPVSMVSAITAGTKNGIIIKGGEYIEELANIKTILFDKTGTLTEGKLEINDIIPINISKNELIVIACSIEKKSKHPIAKAFNEYEKSKKISLKNVINFESVAGKGLKGNIDGETYYIGKKELFNYNNELINEINSLNNKVEIGKTTVIIGNEKNILGFINLSDKIREDSAKVIAKLKENNIESIMLTGDNESTAKSVATNLGLKEYYANLLPNEKVNFVEKVSKQYKNVAMVGDGVNDTPSLARANVGIAMGMEGADIAVETADIVLIQDKISKIQFLINMAKKTMNIVKENVAFAIGVKTILAILGVMGMVELWQAVIIGDMGVTLIVVGNALRIGK